MRCLSFPSCRRPVVPWPKPLRQNEHASARRQTLHLHSRVMKILSRYVFREILTSSLLATALATFVIFLQRLGKFFEIIIRSARDPAVAKIFILVLPPVLLLAIPFGVLVGILV